MKKLLIFILFLSLGLNIMSSQNVKTVRGEYIYVQSEFETISEAEIKAVNKAKIKALEEEFGTLLEQTNVTMVRDGRSEFHSLGLSDVRGEWLGDVKPPVIERQIGENGVIYHKATVWGKAREIISAPIDVEAKLLRVSNDKIYEASEFKHLEQYFVSFMSPVDGYLAIYLMSDDGSSIRLLPYMYSNEESYKIVANKDYFFFSINKLNSGDDINEVNEYEFCTDKEIEYSRLYIIFSPNKFSHPIDRPGGTITYGHTTYVKPNIVDFKHMQDWLVKSRSLDKYMQVICKDITIRK